MCWRRGCARLEQPMNNRTRVSVPLGDKIAYGAGNFATGVSMQILGTYVVFYSTAVLGLPGSLIGLITGLSIFWDAVTDPLMGYLSDRTHHRGLGRRHPYMIAGALGIALTNYLVWNINPSLSPAIKLLLISLWILLLKTFMTVYVTPYTALGAELSTDYNERTSIQGIKSVFFVLGLGFVSVAGLYWFFKPSPEYPAGQLNPESYSLMAAASSGVVLFSALLCILPTLKYIRRIRENNRAFPHEAPSNLKESVARAFRNYEFKRVVFSYMFSNLSSALLANLGLIVFTYTFGMGSGRIAVIIGVQFFFAVLSQYPWARISKWKSKRFALIAGFSLSLLGSIYFSILVVLYKSVEGNPWAFIPFAVLVGSGIGALFTLPLSMVADTVDLDEAEGGRRIEGVYYGALTFVYKFSQAVTLVFIGFILDLAGFDSALSRQRTSTLLSLGLFLGIGAFFCFLFAIISVRKYGLDEAAVEKCRKKIAEQRIADSGK